MSRKDAWRQLINRFDPEETSRAPEWRADRPRSPANEIYRHLDEDFPDLHFLVRGTTGTGKTTELLRIAEARSNKEFVVFLDLWRHFSDVVKDARALQRVSAWEVCFLAGLSLIRTAQEQLGHSFAPERVRDLEQAWTALAKATGVPSAPSAPQLNLGALAKAMLLLASGVTGGAVGVGLGALGNLAGAAKWDLPLGLTEKTLPDQSSEVQNLLASVNVLIGEIQTNHKKVLLIIDGLDRIQEIDQAQKLFLDSSLIGKLACPLVVCCPFALRHDQAWASVRGFRLKTLVNEPVLSQANPEDHGPGVAFFCDLFHKRTQDLPGPPLISESYLKDLAYYSGGRARNFVGLIRRTAEHAILEGAEQVTDALLKKVRDETRRDLESGIHRAYIEILQGVVDDQEHVYPHYEKNPQLVQDLLITARLLPYPNETEWYYPHPLLMEHLVKKRAPGSSGSSSSSG